MSSDRLKTDGKITSLCSQLVVPLTLLPSCEVLATSDMDTGLTPGDLFAVSCDDDSDDYIIGKERQQQYITFSILCAKKTMMGKVMSGQLKNKVIIFSKLYPLDEVIALTLILHPEIKPLLNCVGSKF